MDLRNGGIYSCAAVCAWLDAQAGISPKSAAGKRILAGEQSVEIGALQCMLEPLKGSLKCDDVNQQFRFRTADKAEVAKVLKTLESIAPVNRAVAVLVLLKAGTWGAAAMVVASVAGLFFDGVYEANAAFISGAAVGCAIVGGLREFWFHRV